MTKQQKKAHLAILEEQKQWHQKVRDAKAACDATTNLEELAEAARAYLLAQADVQQYVYGRRNADYLAMYRRRANSEEYRKTLAVFWMAKRYMDEADAATGITPVEQKVRSERDEAEARAFMAGINAMIEGGLRRYA